MIRRSKWLFAPFLGALCAGACVPANLGETFVAEPGLAPLGVSSVGPTDDGPNDHADTPEEAAPRRRWGPWVSAPPEPRADCVAELKAAGIRTAPAKIPVRPIKDSDRVCGAEQVVVYKGSPAKIVYEPTPVVTCAMALSLARFDALVQSEAERALKTKIVRIKHLGTYACRGMAKFPGWPSEHSYANAIDVATFVTKNGREISVGRHYEATDVAPRKKEGDFLRGLGTRAFEDAIFSSVLTPYFNAQHRDHFHLDLARYRIDGTRPRERFFGM